MGIFPVMMRSAALALVVTGVGLAQDATAILAKVAETYSALKNYEFQGTVTTENLIGRTGTSTTEEFVIAFSAPDHFRVEYHSKAMGVWIRASDGTNYYEIRTVNKENSKRPTTQYDIRTLDATAVGAFYEFDKSIASAKVTGSESLPLGGTQVDCWVIEADRTADTLPEGVRRMPTRVWVDKARSLVLKMTSGSEMGEGSKASKNTKLVQFTSAAIEQGVAPDLFQPQAPKKK